MAQIGIIAIVFLVLIGICMLAFAICVKRMQKNEDLLLGEDRMSDINTEYPNSPEEEE